MTPRVILVANSREVPRKSITHKFFGLLSSGQSTRKRYILDLFEAIARLLIPTPMVHPLTNQLNCALIPILILLAHVQVVDHVGYRSSIGRLKYHLPVLDQLLLHCLPKDL